MTSLSLIALPVSNEILSSWLDRTATLHGLHRHHLLNWSGCNTDQTSMVDDELADADLVALARMMRSSETDVWKRTHGWLGCLRRDVICRIRGRISCERCAEFLRERHGAEVYLKHWTEAWRIRCTACGGILSQGGEETFLDELGWYWYEPVIADADRGSARVAAAIEHRRVGDLDRYQVNSNGIPGRHCCHPRSSRSSGLIGQIRVNQEL